MRLRKLIVIMATFALPTAALCEPPAAFLGKTLPSKVGGQPIATTAPAAVPRANLAPQASRFENVLEGLRPEASTTRGANEVRVYKAIAPSVVLIVTKDALGSGAVVGRGGLVVTNLHVVGAYDQVGVVFKPKVEGKQVSRADLHIGYVVRRDEVADLALIRVPDAPGDVPSIQIGSTGSVQIGDDVHAIGHPTGEAWTYTKGIVSQIRRDFTWTAEDHFSHKATVIQTQTPINPGNSGGPLIDNNLEIVGINSFKSDGEGLNFAVSADDIKAFLARGGDRLVSAPAPVASANCKWSVLSQSRSQDPPGTLQALDARCSGISGLVKFIPDDPSAPYAYMVSSRGDGKIDTMFIDENHDGNIEEAYFDTKGTGKFDVKAYFHLGESQPYRYEHLSG
jgi:S1-C subfamily serine protease